MNDKDKEAFDKWWISNKYELTPFYWHNTSLVGSEILATWQAACEYKQKEIEAYVNHLKDFDDEIGRLQAENKKLREALEAIGYLHLSPFQTVKTARKALKEVGEE
jgi:hypothetical protein